MKHGRITILDELLKFKSLLQGVNFDQEVVRNTNRDAVTMLKGAQHFKFFNLLELSRRHFGKCLQKVPAVGIKPKMNEDRTPFCCRRVKGP